MKQTPPSIIGPSLRQQSMESLLSKFQARTALTISMGKSLLIYQNEMIELARSVSTKSQSLASSPDMGGSVSIPDACDTDADTNT
jgi:hypothetical protein